MRSLSGKIFIVQRSVDSNLRSEKMSAKKFLWCVAIANVVSISIFVYVIVSRVK